MTADSLAIAPAPVETVAPPAEVRPRPTVPRLYFPAVDGLRGTAILSVLLYHTSWFSNGLFGVDAFMVLSGFLVTLLLFREAGQTGSISIGGFYRRRFKRLMPGLSITLVATVVLTYLLGGLREAEQIGPKAIAALLQVANWQQIANSNAYWEGFGQINPLAHMWSLSITEQFYLVWPLCLVALFMIFRRSPTAVTVVLFLALPVAGAVAPLMYNGRNSDRLYLGTDVRAVDFIAGAAGAAVVYLMYRRRASHRHARPWRGLTAFATIIGAVALAAIVAISVLTSSYHEAWLYQGGIAGVALLTTVLIAALCHDRGPLVRIFSFGPLTEIGRMSYTIYLLHLPIYWLMQKWLPTIAPYALFIVGGGITWLASTLMHYGVTERLRVRPWRVVRALPTAAVVTAAIVTGAYFLPTAVEARMDPGGQPAVLLLGDSLAGNLADAISSKGRDQFAVVDGSISGCGVMDPEIVRSASGVVWPVSKECKIRERLWRDSVRQTKLRAIVVHVGWDAADQKIGGKWLTPCDSAYRDRYLAKLRHAMDLLTSEAPGVAISLMNERAGSGAAPHQSVLCYNALIDTFVKTSKVRLLDLNAMLCPSGRGCVTTDARGNPLYVDGVHLTPKGEEYVAPLLQQKLVELTSGSPVNR